MIDRTARARQIMRRAHDDGRWQEGVMEILALADDVDREAYQRGRSDEYVSPPRDYVPISQPDGHA